MVGVNSQVKLEAVKLRDLIAKQRRLLAAGVSAGAAVEKKKGPLGRFFAWLGGILSDLTDAVMRANQAPEKTPAAVGAPTGQPLPPPVAAEKVSNVSVQ